LLSLLVALVVPNPLTSAGYVNLVPIDLVMIIPIRLVLDDAD
jgi:hypothetical protein